MRVKKPRVSAIKKSETTDTEKVTRQKAQLTKVNRSPITRNCRTRHIGPLVAKETSGSRKARSSREIVGSTEHDTGNARLLEGRQTRSRLPVAVGKILIRKRRTPRLSEVPEKTNVTRKRGRPPRQFEEQVQGARTKKCGRPQPSSMTIKLRRRSRKMCSSANERKERVGRTILPRLSPVAENSEPNETCKKNRSLKKHKEIAGLENKRGRLQKQKSEPHGGGAKESSFSEVSSARKRVRVQKALISREQKLMEKAAAKQAKAKERELKRAAQLERRKQKLEEQERKKKERLLRKEKKQRLLQQKRERREEERRKRIAKEPRFKRKRRKLDSYMRTCDTEAVNMFISSPCDGILPLSDLSIFWRIFVPGKIFLGRWLILDEVQSHRYGVISYLVVEQGEAATQCVLYAQLMDSSFATLPEEMFFVQIQSERNRSTMFQTIVEARFVDSSAQSPPFYYAVVLLRESVSLYDLWSSYPHPPEGSRERKSWNLGTIGRLAADILEIIELVYEAGYTFRSIEMSHFHLDVRTRRLYLNNASEVVKSTELMDLQLKNGVLLHNYWHGCLEFAPLSWHEREERSVVRVTDCAEALFYIMLELMGLMTWRGLNKEEIKFHKLSFDKSVLPVPLIEYWGIVHRAQEMQVSKVMFHDGYLLLNGRRGGATSSVLDFRKLFMKLLALYKIFGGVGDDDTPYDFDVVQDPVVRGDKQAQLVELFKAVHLMKEKIQTLKADLCALAIRKEYAKRCAAQTRRERAAASARASAFTSELNITE